MPQDSEHPGNLVDLLTARTEQWADRALYYFLPDGEAGGPMDQYSFVDLDRRARAIAVALQSAGLTNQRVLLLYPSGLEFIASFFGCLYAGAVAVPAVAPHPARPERNLPGLRSIATDAGLGAVLTTSKLRGRLQPRLEEAPELRAMQWLVTEELPESDADAWRRPEIRSETLAFLQYTSGSTGQPRGVMLTHDNLMTSLRMIDKGFALRSDEVGVHWLPFYHDMGLIGNILGTLYCGGQSALMSPLHFLQKPLRWLQAISHFQGHISGGPDFAYRLCAERATPEMLEQLDLSSWRVAFTGAEPIRSQTVQKFCETFAPCGFRRTSIYPCYGLAEATLLVTGGRADEPPRFLTVDAQSMAAGATVRTEIHEGDRSRELVGCGKVIEAHELRIADPETRRALPGGTVGEIWVSGPCVAQGYWGKPELGETTFQATLEDDGEGRYLRTGDLGFVDAEGELFFTGRRKDLIILRGRNHYPQDIERTVEEAHTAIRPGCVGAFSIEAGAEDAVVVVCEVKTSGGPEQLQEIAAAVRQAVAFEHDISINVVALLKPGSVPKTSSGKIRRSICKQAYLEKTLAEIVRFDGVRAKSKLRREELVAFLEGKIRASIALSADIPFDPKASLSDLGLDSLMTVEIRNAVLGLGFELSESVLTGGATLEKLVDHLMAASAPVEGSPNGNGSTPTPASTASKVEHGTEKFWARMQPTLDRVERARSLDLYHFEKPITAFDGAWVHCADGERRLMLATHCYLGLLDHPRIKQAVLDAVEQFGGGSHGSRLMGGSLQLHQQLEERIAGFTGREAAMVLSTGYVTNSSVIAALVGPNDWVISDQWNHASILDGCNSSGALFRVYRHNNLDDLEAILKAAPASVVKLVVADGVFSMDGDIADLPGLSSLCRRYGALLMIDEAHSLGVLGKSGRGIEEHFDMPGAVDICMGTFSKTLSSMGGYIAGSRRLIDFLKLTVRGYIFSTAPPASVIAASLAALDVLEEEGPERCERLHRNTAMFIEGLRALDFDTGASCTAIIPVLLGADDRAARMADYGQRHGLFVLPALPPAVPVGTARLRLTVSSAHSPEDLRFALDVLAQGARELLSAEAASI